jgi:predicted transport protein
MVLFKNTSGRLDTINELSIRLERDIQKLTEDNMQTIFGLEFFATEFEHNGLRLDSVAYDHSVNAFVIIEYKRDKSFSVVDQGYAYLALLLNNKAEFILLYNEHTKGNLLTKSSVDWTQSRVIFIAQNFTIHQQQAINFRDMPIELWQVKLYDNQTVLYSQLKASDKTESIKTVTRDSTVQAVSSEIKVYNVNDHFAGQKEEMFSLYEVLKSRIMDIDVNIHENSRAGYIGFSLKENGTDTFVYVHVRNNLLKLHIPRIRPDEVKDPSSGSLTYLKNSFEHKNTPTSVFDVKNEEDVDFATSILRQVIKLRF